MATGKITIGSLAKLEGWLWDTSCVGFGARKQRNGVFYYLRYRHNGSQIMKSTGRHGSPWTPDTARNRAKELLGTLAGGADPFAKPLSKGFGAETLRYLDRKRTSLRAGSFSEVAR
jgi:Arm domain-containing DNA-binding protein